MSRPSEFRLAHGVGEGHLARQHPTRVGRRESLVGDHDDETPRRVEREGPRDDALGSSRPAATRPPEQRSGGVLRVPVDLRRDRQRVDRARRGRGGERQRRRRSEPARDGDLRSSTCIEKLSWPEHARARPRAPRWRSSSNCPAPKPSLVIENASDEFEAHLDVELQRHRERVEARSEVGRTGGNAREHGFSVGVATTWAGKPSIRRPGGSGVRWCACTTDPTHRLATTDRVAVKRRILHASRRRPDPLATTRTPASSASPKARR